MSKSIIIVESPAKSKTIQSYFKNEVTVLSSVGHIRDLAISGPEGLGVDVANDFEPNYVTIRGKNKIVAQLKKQTKGHQVYLATDPDREGEAIAWHLAQILNLDLKEHNRIVFREITKKAVNDALNQPRAIDLKLVNSQESRRILDRIIGFKLSKLLQSKIKSKSAGRVQSVALKLIVDLEKEIEKFVPEEYYLIKAEFENFSADYIIPKDIKISKEEAAQIVASSSNPFKVQSVDEKEAKRYPRPPYITSTLQQDAVNTLNMSSSRVMQIAQKLYEGIEIDGEIVGLITYMRTDSERLSQEFVFPAKTYIESNFGKNYVGFYKSKKSDSAQDAHEAIRPTDLYRTPERVQPFLQKDEYRVYKKIYERALSSLMAPATLLQTEVILNAGNHLYKAEGSQLIFDGFYQVSGDKITDKLLPQLNVGDTLDASEVLETQKFTQPPTRYNEASLIKELEAKGIGRPSTYTSIIQTLKNRQYVEMEKRRFKPTQQGKLTVEELSKYFENIMDITYTSKMETKLDQIAEGKFDGRELLKTFYQNFIPQLENAQAKMAKIKDEVVDRLCPKCGKNLVIRKSKYGSFYGCSGYPKCRYTEHIES